METNQLAYRTQNRLFVPLSKQAFNWFKAGKNWEIRRLNKGQYNTKNIFSNRMVELRKGYNGESLWGKIDQVQIFSNSQELVRNIHYQELVPSAHDENEAVNLINKY